MCVPQVPSLRKALDTHFESGSWDSNLNEKIQFLLTESLSPFFLGAPDPFRALQSIKHIQQQLLTSQIQIYRPQTSSSLGRQLELVLSAF